MTRGFAYEEESPIAAAMRQNIRTILEGNQLSSEVSDILSRFEVRGGLQYAGLDGAARGQLNSRPFLFAPRFGFAYKLSDKMVVRGGLGFYFEPLTRIGNPPQDGFNARTNYVATETKSLWIRDPDTGEYVLNPEQGPRPANSMSNPFPGDLVQPYGSGLGLLTNIGQGVTFVNPDRTAPRVLRAEFGIQRELPGRIGVNANYLTTRWNGRAINLNINEVPDSYLAYGEDFLSQSVPNPFYGIIPSSSSLGRATISLNQLLLPHPHFTTVTTNFNLGYAWYNGFNLNVSRRSAAAFSSRQPTRYPKG